jgi:signal transduction histidine kinase
LKDAVHARDEFLSIIAHEVRTPAAAMRLAAQSLDRQKLDPTVASKLDVIERSYTRLLRFVDDLVDYARIRTEGVVYSLEDVDLVDVARAVIARFAGDAKRSGSMVSLVADGPVVGAWDRACLEHMVSNLLSNAIKFGLGNPITISVTGDAVSARIAVRDEGIGIAASRQRQIFEPFERAVSTRHYSGVGLGLYIVKTIAEGLGGSVGVESAAQKGSTFTVTLPFGAPHAQG